MKQLQTRLLLFILLSLSCLYASAQNLPEEKESELLLIADSVDLYAALYAMPTIKLLGEKPRLLGEVPGSATYLSPKTIQSLQVLSGNEVFRTVSGVHVIDEEGLGLRANIGIRGLDPDRSSKVLILEDGIPVALAPYGEPQMYYTPVMDRMQGVEILKGSGQILFGPQTVGGVINYITADPPSTRQGKVRLKVGEGGFLSGLVGYGNTVGKVGYQVNFLHKRGDNVGVTQFRVNDLSSKIKINISKRSKLGVKLGFYNETSNATYIGLTQAMYDQGGNDFANIAPDDRLEVRRISGSATHEYRWDLNLKLQTTAFGYTTTRNWQRQDFSSAPTSNMTGVVWGDESITGGALYMKNSNGHRNRQFEVAGVESKLTKRYSLGSSNAKLEGGIRYLYERAFEQRINGQKATAQSGVLKNDEIRTGQALSLFVQNQMNWTEQWSLTFGLRSETFFYDRHILRINQIDTSIISSNSITQLIPGVGLNFNLKENMNLFAGLHRGFAPPRIKDAISNSGAVYQLDPELSWNAELGIRSQFDEFLEIEMTAFYMNFSNQIIPVSESSGGTGAGLVNGGSTLHKGLEFGFDFNIGQFFLPEHYSLKWQEHLTLVQAKFNKDRFLANGESLLNIKNNRTPYAPKVLLSSSLQFDTPYGLGIRLTGNYTGSQFTDESNTETPIANGRIGKLDGFFVLDGTLQWEVKKLRTTFSLAVKNLTDERYIASRRPQGIRVGLPRFFSGGVEVRF